MGLTLLEYVYLEIEDILQIPEDASLAQLDATLARFVSFCSSYHGMSILHILSPA